MKKLILLGESKFDKLRRISLIKTISDDMGMKDGDYVSFFMDEDGDIILKKKPRSHEISNLSDDSLSPEHQKLLFDAYSKLLMNFYENPSAEIDINAIVTGIIGEFPEENRKYLTLKFREMIFKMSDVISNLAEQSRPL